MKEKIIKLKISGKQMEYYFLPDEQITGLIQLAVAPDN